MKGTRTALTQRWYDEGFYSKLTRRDRMESAVADFGSLEFRVVSAVRPAVTTQLELMTRGRDLAGSLLDLGLVPGDIVALQLPNWIEGAVMYHACLQIGLVVLPIVHIYGTPEVDQILASSGARAIVTPDSFRSVDYTTRGYQTRDDLRWIVVGETPEGAHNFAALEARGHRNYQRPELSPDDVHITNYTSGTTAEAKGVLHTHNSLWAESLQLNAASQVPRGLGISLSPNPLGHIGGLIANILLPLFHGRSLIMVDAWDPGEALSLMQQYRVTASGGAPYFLASLLDHPDFASFDLERMDIYGCGGAGVAPGLIEQADAVGWRAYRSYGSTEHPSVTVSSVEAPLEKRAYTDGLAGKGTELRIVDEGGATVPTGTAGCILSIGPDMCVGYRDEEHNSAFSNDGWFDTGDIGKLDDEGYLTITDRVKDIIIRGGENISAQEVENILVLHPHVAEAAAIAVPDEKFGERVCAVVRLASGQSFGFEELQAHFQKSGVAKQKTPERLETVKDFPRTPAGKVKIFVLRDRYGS